MTMATTKTRAKTKTTSKKTAPKQSRSDQRKAWLTGGKSREDALIAFAKKVRDSWVNPYTGYGTTRDKTAVGYFSPEMIVDATAWLNLYEGDSIAARIVDLIPEEMLRQGLTL